MKKQRHKGSAALIETGVATLIFSAYMLALTNVIATYNRESDMRHSADEALLLAKTTAAWISSNTAAALSATTGDGSYTLVSATSCVEGSDNANGWKFFRLSRLPKNTGGTNDSNPCGSLLASKLATQTLSSQDIYNRFGQSYWVAMRAIDIPDTQPNPTNQTHKQIEAVLFTRDGPKISDESLHLLSNRIGPAGGAIYQSPPSGFSQNQIVLFDTENSGINGSAFTPGHAAINLNYIMDPKIDDFIRRGAQPGDNYPTRMDAKLYMSNADALDKSIPVNINMNGKPSPFSPQAMIDGSRNNTTDKTKAPNNSIYGIRQTDTQILTAGNSVADPFKTVNDQSNYERSQGKTVNDTALGQAATLVNANFNITEGHRLTAADGFHITASANSIQHDTNHSSDDGQNSHQSAGYQTGRSVPGLIWDNAPNTSGGTSHSGLMTYLSNDPTNGRTQGMGVDISPIQTIIATYNKNGENNQPVGFEADGGFRAPVYYDSTNMSYLVDPSGTSQLNDLILDSSGRQRNGTNISGSIYTSGLYGNPWPDGSPQTGLYTYDLFSNGGSIGNANIKNGKMMVNAYMNRNGVMYATGHTDSGFITINNVVTEGTHCLGDELPVPNTGDGETDRTYIEAGTLARDGTGRPLFCSGDTHSWESVGKALFQTMSFKRYPIQQWIANNSSTPIYITTLCDSTVYGSRGFYSNITATIRAPSGESHSIHSTQVEGSRDNTFTATPHIAFVVPAGGSFYLDEFYGNSQTETNFCQETTYQ